MEGQGKKETGWGVEHQRCWGQYLLFFLLLPPIKVNTLISTSIASVEKQASRRFFTLWALVSFVGRHTPGFAYCPASRERGFHLFPFLYPPSSGWPDRSLDQIQAATNMRSKSWTWSSRPHHSIRWMNYYATTRDAPKLHKLSRRASNKHPCTKKCKCCQTFALTFWKSSRNPPS